MYNQLSLFPEPFSFSNKTANNYLNELEPEISDIDTIRAIAEYTEYVYDESDLKFYVYQIKKKGLSILSFKNYINERINGADPKYLLSLPEYINIFLRSK